MKNVYQDIFYGSHEESEITTKMCFRMLINVKWNSHAYQRAFITILKPWVLQNDFKYAFKSECALPFAEVKGFFHVFNNSGFIVDWKDMNFHPFHLINKKYYNQQAILIKTKTHIKHLPLISLFPHQSRQQQVSSGTTPFVIFFIFFFHLDL
jgi:hypothetical protein